MTKTARDYQRSKVYAWEDKHVRSGRSQEKLTLDQCRELAAEMYGSRVKVLAGRDTDARATAHLDKSRATISLPKWARTPSTIAHEIAHWLTHRYNPSLPHHGGYFVGFYIELLVKHCGEHRDYLIRTAKDHGVRVTFVDRD